jgi:hypothetical protein
MLIDWLAALYTAVAIAFSVCRVPLFFPLTIRLTSRLVVLAACTYLVLLQGAPE